MENKRCGFGSVSFGNPTTQRRQRSRLSTCTRLLVSQNKAHTHVETQATMYLTRQTPSTVFHGFAYHTVVAEWECIMRGQQ
eukprot:5610235-Pyramimonas_sp.AAC.1